MIIANDKLLILKKRFKVTHHLLSQDDS